MPALVSLSRRAKLLAVLCLSSLCSSCLCGESFAALDAETKKPYKLTVVLHVADNRLLTDAFRERVERELREGLQAALGDLGDVKVVREHPKLAEVLDRGLRSLDTWNERSGAKTHFVLIDFSGTDYEIEARQYDGLTGTATPMVRRDRTQDREFVGRAAALMVERDLGIVATFQAWPKGTTKPQKVRLELKGGGLDAPLDRWVRKGDVFAVVQVPTGSGSGRLVPDAIVQIETPPGEREAACSGNLFWRHKPPGSAGVAGYRCVKLGAAPGPLRVRLVQVDPRDGKPGVLPSPAPTLLVRRHDFTGKDELRLESDVKAAGSYDTGKLGDNGRFDRVAFVTVQFDGAARAEVPVVLLDDQPVTIPVTLLEKDDAGLAELAKRLWRRSVLDSYAEQSTAFAELSAKKDTPRAKLIEMAREAAKRSEEDLARLRAERDEAYGQNPTDADQRDLAQAEQRLKAIKSGLDELNRYVARQEQIDKEEKDPKNQRLLEQIERGKLLEKDGELGKAIALYGEILADGFKSEELEQRIKKLHEVWDPKSPEHRQARDFIYHTWPTLETAALAAQLPEARKALAVCRDAGDYVGPQKLYKGIQLHAARLLKEAEGLRDVNEEDAKQLKVIKDLGAELTRLETEIKAWLDKAPK